MEPLASCECMRAVRRAAQGCCESRLFRCSRCTSAKGRESGILPSIAHEKGKQKQSGRGGRTDESPKTTRRVTVSTVSPNMARKPASTTPSMVFQAFWDVSIDDYSRGGSRRRASQLTPPPYAYSNRSVIIIRLLQTRPSVMQHPHVVSYPRTRKGKGRPKKGKGQLWHNTHTPNPTLRYIVHAIIVGTRLAKEVSFT